MSKIIIQRVMITFAL